MNQKHEKLISLLKELFQLNQPDLDFGLYRVMRSRSTEISAFLQEDLLRQVKDSFAKFKKTDNEQLRKDLDEVLQVASKHFDHPEDSKEVQRIRSKLEENENINVLENEVYDHLYNFFRRYYSQGDFLAKRVYKKGVYAIPYSGEEVLVHWANRDQYYIKTSEYLKNYTFCLRPESKKNPWRVRFQLLDATEGEHDNIKESDGTDRVFVLAITKNSEHEILKEVDGEQGKELIVRFEYRPAKFSDWPSDQVDQKKHPPTQKDLISLAVEHIFTMDDPAIMDWLIPLRTNHTKANGEPASYSRLEAHLKRFTARNTFDYFIHKDLRRFLLRELDFYIKNEVLHLDDIENQSPIRAESYFAQP